MDMMHSVLNRGCSIWDQKRIGEDEFRRRLDHVREGMKDRGIDLLLVYGDSWRFGHLAFVSHFLPKNRGALAVIPLQGEPALVVQEPSRNNPFSSTLTWIQEVHSVGKFAQGVGEALKTRGPKPKRVGLAAVEEQFNIREWRELAALLDGAEFQNCSAFLASLRLVKSPSELALLKETSRILERSLAVVKSAAKAGQKEFEITALIEREARRQGVEDFRLLLARSGDPGIGLRPAGDATLKKGEAVLVLAAASYQRYWAELGQTFCLGQPRPEIAKSHELAHRVFEKLIAGAKPGTSQAAAGGWLAEIPSQAAKESLKAYGLGNGLGLEPTEEPYLGKEGDHKIQPGMVLTLRACFTAADCGSFLISRPYLVTGSALEPLVKEEELASIEA